MVISYHSLLRKTRKTSRGRKKSLRKSYKKSSSKKKTRSRSRKKNKRSGVRRKSYKKKKKKKKSQRRQKGGIDQGLSPAPVDTPYVSNGFVEPQVTNSFNSGIELAISSNGAFDNNPTIFTGEDGAQVEGEYTGEGDTGVEAGEVEAGDGGAEPGTEGGV
jgi:hypothetical protein